MTARSDEDDRVLLEYREALLAEAELARADLDELDDHVRMLADDLHASGMARTDAIREACRRLGDPGALAREHARVRSPFGAKLARVRAWSAALLLAPWWLAFARLTLGDGGPGLTSLFGVNLVISMVALCGLVARVSWARAIIAGALSWLVVDQAIAWAWSGIPAETTTVWRIACLTGAFVLVAPWRRSELAPAGYVIVLLAWAYHGVNMIATYQLTAPDQLPFVDPAGAVAFVATLVAGIGTLVRARWAALATAAAAVALAIGYADLHTVTSRFADPTLATVQILGAIGAGTVAAALATVLAWRSARSMLGTLAHLAD
jgi:hypothetical protein